MSNKLFMQIILLIIIAAVVFSLTKIGMKCAYRVFKGKAFCPYIAPVQK